MEPEEVQGLDRLREFAAMVSTEVVPMTMDGVQPVVHALRPLRKWMAQCSKHLRHIEERAMWQEVLGHEMMRHFAQLIEGFSPPPSRGLGLALEESGGRGHMGGEAVDQDVLPPH